MDFIEENWNRMAQAYEDFTEAPDSYSYTIEWPSIQRMLPDLAGKRVLDLGCGTGRFTFLLEQRGASEVIGVDLSQEMLTLAEAKATERGSHARFVKGDMNCLQALSLGDFDLIFSSTSTHYLQVLEPFFSELNSLLKPEGHCVLSVMSPVYTAQYPIAHGDVFPDDDEWTVRYLDRRPRAYMQPWIEYNEDVPDELSRSYHFTFSDYLTAALKAGLTLEQTDEPLPPESWKAEFPNRYDGFLETPSFWVFRLAKK